MKLPAFCRIVFAGITVILAGAGMARLLAEEPEPALPAEETAPAEEAAEPEMMTIDFEGLPASPVDFNRAPREGSLLSQQFVESHGVVFSSGLPYVIVIELGRNHATSGVNAIGAVAGENRLTFHDATPITIKFVLPGDPNTKAVTDFVSIRGDLQGDSEESPTLTAFDINGQIIERVSQEDVGGQTWTISAPGIHSVRFGGVHRTDDMLGGVGLDDLQFHAVTLPPVEQE